MSKLIVVDINSGFIWGVSDASDPIAACRGVNENEAKEFGLTYEDIGGACFNGRSGFEVTDGQDREQIERVLDLTSVGRIVTSSPDEDE